MTTASTQLRAGSGTGSFRRTIEIEIEALDWDVNAGSNMSILETA